MVQFDNPLAGKISCMITVSGDSITLTGKPVSAEQREEIGKLLTKAGKLNAKPDNRVVQERISNFEYTSSSDKKYSGTLIKYDDGSCEFIAKRKGVDGKEFTMKLCFKNSKELEKGTPFAQINNPNDPEKMTVTQIKYHRNGKYAASETHNAQGELIQKQKFNKNGKVEIQQNYKDGKLTGTNKYSYNKDGSYVINAYDKDNNLTQLTKMNTQGKKDEIVSYKDGKINGSSKFTYNNEDGSYTVNTFSADKKLTSTIQYDKTGRMLGKTDYDQNGNVITSIEHSSDEVDGHFGLSAQVSEGDCYLMAPINALRMAEGGEKVLQNLIKTSTNDKGEKVYTVTLPGALAAAEGMKTEPGINPDKMHITGTYEFTEAELNQILQKSGKKYSLGDADVILLEAAFEKYRTEVAETLKDNPNINKKNACLKAGLQTGLDPKNILAGGKAWDSTFMLTGNISEAYVNSKVQYGLNIDDLKNGTATPTLRNNTLPDGMLAKSVPMEVASLTSSQKQLNKMLDELAEDSKDGHIDHVAIAGFRTVQDGKQEGGHALTIKSVTADTVTMVNPWHPDTEVTMSRADFIKCVNSLSVSTKTAAEMSDTPAAQPVQPAQPAQPAPSAQPEPQPITQNNSVNSVSAQQTHTETKVTVKKGQGYNALIKEYLAKQGITEPTKEQLTKAKRQFEAANPGLVKIYNGPKAEWKGNRYLLTGVEYNIPKFEV